MTVDLFRKLWRNPYVQQYGRLGQGQNGVDVYGFVGKSKNLEGVQCKLADALTERNVRQEYVKSLKYRPRLSRFIIVTTAKRDTAPQQAAATLSQEEEYPCDLMFWEDFSQKLGDYPKLLRKHYPQFLIVEMIGDSPSKLVRLGVDVTYFELMLTMISSKERHYGGTILVSSLQNNKCITYRLGDHWSRLEGVVGITGFDAFCVSTWLNAFKSAEELMRIGQETLSYELTDAERAEARKHGFMPTMGG